MNEVVKPLQPVSTPAEAMALEIATVWLTDGQHDAAALLNAKVREHGLVYWEASALANITTCMIHGRKWKKD